MCLDVVLNLFQLRLKLLNTSPGLGCLQSPPVSIRLWLASCRRASTGGGSVQSTHAGFYLLVCLHPILPAGLHQSLCTVELKGKRISFLRESIAFVF